MIIGVPRERKTLERRVAITPDGVGEIVRRGHKVLIETKAGDGSFFPDNQYVEAGGKIVSTLKDLWGQSDIIVKVKEPHPDEYELMRPGQIIFDYLHLASMPELTKVMLDKKVTGIAYELVQNPDGRLPLLEPMSEVAGKLAVLNAANFLLAQNGGRGELVGGTIGVPPIKVVVVGGGVAGRAAVQMAIGLGASVTVLDRRYERLESLYHHFQDKVRTVHSSHGTLMREIQDASILIGAVLIPGAAAPRVITREMIRSMAKGGVFVDISIDQGGCAETSTLTSLDKPITEIEGIMHYGVPNMPAQTPRTSTKALTAATLPYIADLASGGLDALKRVPLLRGALNVHDGKLTSEQVAEAVGMPFTSIDRALG